MAFNPVTIASKTIGVIAAGLVLTDSHKVGKAVAEVNRKSSVATVLTNEYLHNQKMPNVDSSLMKAKNRWLKFRLDNNLEDIVYSAKGYWKGFKGTITNDIIPAALAAGAVIFGRFGRVCALGLLAYGVKVLVYDVLSVGKTNYVN